MQNSSEDKIANLNQLFEGLFKQGKYQEALIVAQQSVILTKNNLGEDHLDYAISLNNLAGVYYVMGDYDKARPLYIEAKDAWKNLLGEEHPNYAISINNLAVLYQSIGSYDEAKSLFIQSLMIRKNALGKSHPAYAGSLYNLACLYYVMGDYDKARPLYIEAGEIWKNSLGEDDPNYATSLTNLGLLYQATGEYDKAVSLCMKACVIFKKVLGENHPKYAASLNNLAGAYYAMGDYDKAAHLYIEAGEIWKNSLGEDHPDYATNLTSLGLLYQATGEYDKAVSLCMKACVIFKKVLGENHPKYAASLNNLAGAYYAMGDYDKAKPFYIAAAEIWKNSLGEDHPDYATNLTSLGLLYQATGEYDKAVSLCMKACVIFKKVLGENHPKYAASLNNLAMIYQAMGSYDKAAHLYIEAGEIWKNSLGEDHPDYATSLNNLAGLYQVSGEYDKSILIYKQTMMIRRKFLGDDHPEYATSLNNLAGLYCEMGDYDKAKHLYIEAEEIWKNSLGKDHPRFAIILHNLATVYQSKGAYEQAEPLYKKAIKKLRKMSINDQRYYVIFMHNYAVLHAATDRINKAFLLMKEASTIEDKIIEQFFSFSSEEQRIAYLSSIQSNIEAVISLAFQHFTQSPNVLIETLSLVLRRKAITAEILAAQRYAILGGKYPYLRDKLNHLNVLRMQIARKEHDYPGKEASQIHHRVISEWISEKEFIEAELSRQIPEMRLEQIIRKADRYLIANCLPHGSTLLEFVRYKEFSFKAVPAKGDSKYKPPRYCVFVLPSEQPDSVALIDLGEAEEIDRLITSYKSKLTDMKQAPLEIDLLDDSGNTRSGIFSWLFKKEKLTREQRSRKAKGEVKISALARSDMGINEGLQLYSCLIAPLKAAIGNFRHLVIAPDSQLSLIPFEVIPTPEGGYLVDQYHISYVGVGRDILRFNSKIQGNSEKPLVMASPDFDLVATEKKKTSESVPGNGRRSRDFSKYAEPFRLLKGAKLEGEQVGKLIGIKPLLEQEALEGRLKSSSSPHILHIATHGFFFKDQEMPANKEGGGFRIQGVMGMQRLSGLGIENPMLRSGLVFSGVNTWMKNGELPPEAEDGVLTAEDVMTLDLTHTDLAVLSACDTGLGDVKVGEGVFGLRRAFAIAGAKTLVMSLWKVNDICTQELMEDFYRRILAGTPKAEALRNAQIKLREKYPHPRDWGAFICQGDPGPLSMDNNPQ